MRFIRFTLCAATLALTGFACQKKADTATAEKAIRDGDAAWNAAVAAKNDSALAVLYADNGTLMPPNHQIVTGTAAIRSYFALLWPMNATLVITPTAITVASSGDMATDVGTYTFSAGQMNDTGKYLVHWHKMGPTWKVVDDMWNSDNPPAPPPADSTAKKKSDRGADRGKVRQGSMASPCLALLCFFL
jgi:ketosteroid isomerase-like protein